MSALALSDCVTQNNVHLRVFIHKEEKNDPS